MAPKRKQSKSKNTSCQQTRNRTWTEDETISYAKVLCATEGADRSWLYQIENYALKRTANELLFQRIKEDFEISIDYEEGDDTFTIEQLRAKFKWFKKQWRSIDTKIKNGTGLGAKDTAVPSWYDIMNPHFSEAVDDMTSVSSRASDIDTTFDSTGSDSTPGSSDDDNSLNGSFTTNKNKPKPAGRIRKTTRTTSSEGQSGGISPDDQNTGTSFERHRVRTSSDQQSVHTSSGQHSDGTLSEGQNVGGAENATEVQEVEHGEKDKDQREKKSPIKKTRVRLHPKKLFSKPKSQTEAMMQVAKSIETSSKEQEKNRDERLKILLDAERKRDELFYAYQKEQAEANRRHEMLLAQLLMRESSTAHRPLTQNHVQMAHSSNDPLSYGYSLAGNLQPAGPINTSNPSTTSTPWDDDSYSLYKL